MNILHYIYVLIYKYFLLDGIVAINKPYGIPIYNKKTDGDFLNSCHKIVNAVNYSIYDVMPYLTKELDVPALIPFMGAEKCINV